MRKKKASPKAHWYIADLVMQISVGSDPRTVVHINSHLIHAETAEAAADAAMMLGKENETHYPNPQGRQVRIKFRGLKDLIEVYEELKHGAEIMYEQRQNLTRTEIRKLVKKRSELTVFGPRGFVSEGPNYMPATIAKKMRDAGFDI